MMITIVSKKVEVTDAIREKIESKFYKLERYINKDTEINIKIDVKKRNQKIEATIFTQNGTILRAEESQEDLYSAIDLVCDKLYKQMRKLKTQMIRKNKKNESIRFENIEEYIEYDNEKDSDIKRIKKFKIDKPMTSDEAIFQMDLLGHNFFIYKDIDTEEISIVYKRHKGYGLIEQI